MLRQHSAEVKTVDNEIRRLVAPVETLAQPGRRLQPTRSGVTRRVAGVDAVAPFV